MRTANLFCFFLLSFLVIGCYSADQIEVRLKTIKTAEDEAAAFEDIGANWLAHLGFYDNHDNQLDRSTPLWWKNLHTVEFITFTRVIKYKIIKPENVFILMRE